MYGYVNSKGDTVIKPQYEDAGSFSFSDKLAAVKKDGKYGYINLNGEVVVPFAYEVAQYFSGGFAVIGNNKLYGIIDRTGKEIIPVQYSRIDTYGSGPGIRYVKDKKYGFYDIRLKKEVVSPKYDFAGLFSEGISAVQLNGKWGFIDLKGKEIIPFQFEEASGFMSSRAVVRINGKWGSIDKSGKLAVAAEYDSITDYFKSNAFASKNGKWGIIDKDGKVKLSFEFGNLKREDVEMIDLYPRARAFKNSSMFLLDIVSGVALPVDGFDDVITAETTIGSPLVGRKKNKYALLDANARALTEAVYDTIYLLPDAYARTIFIVAVKEGKFGILGKDGKPQTRFDYDGASVMTEKDLWLVKGNNTLRANVKESEMPAPYSMQKIDELIFADAYEVSVGEWLAFLSDDKGNELLASLLPDTNAVEEKVRPVYRAYFSDNSSQMSFYSGLLGKKMRIHIQPNANKKEIEKLLKFPVTGITFEQAQQYCEWRSQQFNNMFFSGEDGTSIQFRLPTEEDWERMAIDGNGKNKTCLDSVNDKGCNLFNYKASAECETAKQIVQHRGAGTVFSTDFWPSYIGIHNMFGNVAEMTADKGVAKGGSYRHYAAECDAKRKQQYNAVQSWLGFRCVAVYVQTP